jgi:PAS domain S-box-containing protein
LIESVKDYAIMSLDPDGHVISWNTGAHQIKGYASHEIIGSHFSRFYRPEAVEAGHCEKELAIARATGRFEEEGWRVKKDGTEFWANVIISAIRAKDGSLLGFSKITRDLTERRRSEEEVRKREAQLREAQNIARLGSWEWDIATDKIFWSDQLFKIFGISAKNFDPSFEAYLSRLDPLQREKVQQVIQRSMVTGEDFSFEHTVKNRDGSLTYVYSRGHVIKDENGQIIKMMGTAQDITDQKRIENELVRNKEQLEERVNARTAELHQALEREKEAKGVAEAATLAKMQFLANMSHEIRTPMNAILGFADLLSEHDLSLHQKDFLNRIKTNGHQLLQIIDDILDLSRFEAGKVPLEKGPVALISVVGDVVNSLSSLADRKGLSLQVTKEDGVPASVYTDPLRLGQILTNLIGNAIKFTEKGRVQVRLRTDNTDGRVRLAIDVEDSGIGIAPAHQTLLFQLFSQADGSIVRKFGGTGLGLALSRRIAEALGGELQLSFSEPGKGSCFTFKMALEEISTEARSPSSPDQKTSGGRLPFEQTLNILLAEDSEENQVLIHHYLKPEKIHLDTAKNGFEALSLAANKDYDLVLMDLQMPELDGLEATRRLRAAGLTSPIIALTAHAFKEDRDRAFEAGCSDYLTKPVNRDMLLKTIENAVKNRKNLELEI